jgi:hypothetical protein
MLNVEFRQKMSKVVAQATDRWRLWLLGKNRRAEGPDLSIPAIGLVIHPLRGTELRHISCRFLLV